MRPINIFDNVADWQLRQFIVAPWWAAFAARMGVGVITTAIQTRNSSDAFSLAFASGAASATLSDFRKNSAD